MGRWGWRLGVAPSCSVLVQEPASGPLSEVNRSSPSALLRAPSSSFSPQMKLGLSALVSPGGGRLGGVGGSGLLRASAGVSIRDAGFHSVVGGAAR